MRKPIIAGNWKMNNTKAEAEELLTALKPLVKDVKGVDIVVCVPFTDIEKVKKLVKGSKIRVGAQNVSWADKGAFTGEISAAMLIEAGAEYVVIGHSERRQYFGETDETVNKRTVQALKNGLKPIVCVGETLSDREGGYKPVYYVGMTQYDATFTNIHTAFAPRELKNTLGEYLAHKGFTQARVAETEKYAHVTFFFNGGVEKPNDGEQRVLVASPKVATYDLQPEMSAPEVAQKALEVIGNVDVLILNFANCDMVGHTGVFDAAVKAVKTVDECLSRLIPAIQATGGTALVTADHGNAEQMTFDDGSPCTSHTTNPVPFILVGDKFESAKLKKTGALCDVAPTLLDVMGVAKPEEMEGESLIEKR